KNVWLSIEHDTQRFFEALEIGDKDFNPAIWCQLADRADGLGENPGTANVVVIAVYAGNDGVVQPESGNRLCGPPWFFPIKRLGPPLWHGAKSAAACADVTQE